MCSGFVKPLMLWYNTNARDLPWRRTKNPYRIWVSEIMLQQTQVEAVKSYYNRFLTALPYLCDLAVCPENELLKLWEGLGYYSRVKNMKKAAILIMEKYGGRFPDRADELRMLPGIGDYTAGAIASIAFGRAEPAVDGNVLRVYTRLTGLREDIMKEATRNKIRWRLSGLDLPDGENWGNLNQAFMDFGSSVCLANAMPLCDGCPLKDGCIAFSEGTVRELPVRSKKADRKKEQKTVLLVRDGELTALRKRPEEGLLSGMYEFPNKEGVLTEKEALNFVREHGCEPLKITPLPEAKHLFSHIEWQMTGYEIRISQRNTEVREIQKEEWIFADPEEIENKYPVPSAFRAYARLLRIRIGKKPRRRENEDSDSGNTLL
ncbi:MAG TPA: A/G-specific adenine glycosylase [Lachnospiraceae bacterium]|nr:A/G-specific adenine glycosylase [Lachnospiraceae bacterium]